MTTAAPPETVETRLALLTDEVGRLRREIASLQHRYETDRRAVLDRLARWQNATKMALVMLRRVL
jgi:hypothetical protein